MKQKNEKQVELYPVCSHSSGYEEIFPRVLSRFRCCLEWRKATTTVLSSPKIRAVTGYLIFCSSELGATTIDLRGGKNRATDANVMKKTSTPCKDSSDTKEIKAQSSWDTVLRVREIEH